MDSEAITSWVNLLIQVPLVGVFIWFALKVMDRIESIQERYLESMEKRDTAYLKSLDSIGDQVALVHEDVHTLRDQWRS